MIPGCSQETAEIEQDLAVVSALGDTLNTPPLDRSTQVRLESELHEARLNYEKNPDRADYILAYGRRHAYLGQFSEAISIYTEGIRKFPTDPRFWRHRGHRLISVRKPDRALSDLKKAAALAGPVGGASTDTLRSNISYYMGLAHFLSGDAEQAASAFEKGLEMAYSRDMEIATRYWYYLALRRAGEDLRAAEILEPVTPDIDLKYDDSYHRLLLVFKGICHPESLLDRSDSSLNRATIGYGIANWHYLNGRSGLAMEHFREVYEGDHWSAFGYIAAENDLVRLNRDLASLESPDRP